MRRRIAPLVLLLAAASGRAQGPPVFAPAPVDLPVQTVQALLQDGRGFLWVGTADGLVRFDGRRARRFARLPGVPGALASNAVQALAEGPDGALWVATGAGVCRLADEAAGRFECPPPRLDALDVLVAADGVWALTADALWRLDGAAFRRVEGPYRGEGTTRNVRVRGGQAVVLDGATGGAEVRASRLGRDGRGAAGETVTLPPAMAGLADRDGRVLALPVGPLRAGGGVGEGWGVLGRATTASAGGTTWIGADAGLFRWNGRTLEGVPVAAGSVLGESVLAVAVDASGAVWVGTRGGLFVHDPARARFAHLDPGAEGAASPVMAVETDGAGRRWVGTLGGGLLRYDHGGRAVPVPTGPGGAVVWDVHARPEAVWVATDGGLCRIAPDGRRCWGASPARPAGPAYVYALADDGAGGVWAGGAALVRLDADGRELRRVPFRELSGRGGTLSALFLDRRGRLWIGGEKRGLWRIDRPDGPARRVAPALAATTVWSLHEAADGVLWLGTSDGLVRLVGDRVEPVPLDLPSSTVYAVVGDGDDVWLSTGRGLARYRPADGALSVFGVADGVAVREFNRRAGHRAPDGRLWFGGMEGATAFAPAAIADALPAPAAVVTRVRVEGGGEVRAYGPEAVGRLGAGTRTVAFDVSAPLPAGGARLRYGYRLGDGPWTAVEGEPTVRFAGLAAGRHTFEVRASRGDGVWGAAAAVAFAIAPPWFATGWARALAALALGGAVALAWRLRVRAIRREERMRWRIASDLHDDIGSGLASVALLSEHVRARADLSASESAQLSTVARAAHTMVERLREIVWFVDPAHERAGAFSARVREVAVALVGPGVALDLPARSALDAARPGWRRDLFLVLKEALHNASRHAPGAAVSVRVAVAGGRVEVAVRDDGPGFDVTETPEGTGLRSLRRRAEALGGTLAVESRPGGGTVVVLSAPIP